MSKDFEHGIRTEQVLAQRYINGDISGTRAEIQRDADEVELVLLVVGELALAYGYEDAVGRVQRMMGKR
jgi:hypothetical protein